MAENPKKKKQLVDKQIELIDKQIKAVPRKLTNIEIQNLLLEREKLILSKEDTQQPKEEDSGVTPTMGLKAMGAAAAFGGDREMTAATGLLVAGIGKKIFGGLFKKKEDKDVDTQKYAGSPEKKESKNDNYTDNSVIISILNKILNAFENDNERMRRSIRDAAEKKLESDPTPDTPGGPVKEGDDKKSGMNKLLMFGAIAGLLGLAYTFKDEIAKVLEPITDMLGITNPLEESDKEDYEFDIMDALGVTSLIGMLGISNAGAADRAGAAAAGGAARAGAAAAGGAARAGGAEKTNARPRHPAGTVINGKKVGGQFMNVDPETIKDVVKKSILKRAGGAFGKILPGLGLAFGLYEAFTRAKDGDLTGAGIALAGGAVALVPSIGTGASIALTATNIARDVYNDAYGVYPEADESGEKAKRAEEILKEVVKALSPKSPDKPMTGEQRNALTEELTRYSEQIKAERAGALPNPNRRKMLAGRVHIKAKLIGIDRETVDTELNELKTAGAPERDIESNKQLQELIASNTAANAEAGAGTPAAGAPSAAAGAPSASGAPAGSGMPSAYGSSGAPVASSPPPASETTGSAVTAATMGASEAQNSVTVLPPIVNNESNTMKSGNENASKAQKMTMQVRLNDDVFRKAVESTAAVLKAA